MVQVKELDDCVAMWEKDFPQETVLIYYPPENRLTDEVLIDDPQVDRID